MTVMIGLPDQFSWLQIHIFATQTVKTLLLPTPWICYFTFLWRGHHVLGRWKHSVTTRWTLPGWHLFYFYHDFWYRFTKFFL